MSENIDPNFMGEGIYREHILDHYKHPHNHGMIEDADIKYTEQNPTCGDVVTVTLNIQDNTISDIKFQGRGCAISQASASLLTDEIKGQPVEKVKSMHAPDIVKMLGIEVGPVRTKCATLALAAVKAGIEHEKIQS